MYLQHGTLLQGGKYKIEKALGQGSFGITYLATANFSTDSNLGKMNVVAKVAIKEFFMGDVNSRKNDGSSVDGSTGSVFTNYRHKFRKEAENLAKLSHSNIVRVFDVFDENDTTYYVMEFLEGDNLDDYIKSKGRVDEDEAIAIIREIGGALDYMHSRKMLHLDLKPKNVMHRSDDTNHLIDFGLSKQFADDGEPESSTTIGLGTPGYAPLEQSQYKHGGSFPATLDVYALGATMFKLLTGQRPPEATVILNEGFPREVLKERGISEGTIRAMEKAMTPAKTMRYQSVRSFLNALGEGTVFEPKPQPTPKRASAPEPSIGLLPRPTLVSVWKSRNMITNIVCVGALLATLGMFDNSAYRMPLEFPTYYALGVVLSISSLMYGNLRLSWLPIPALIIEIYLGTIWLDHDVSEYMLLSTIPTMAYIVVWGSLFLKKNGKSALAAMQEMRHKEFYQPEKWPTVTKVATWLITGVLLISLVMAIIKLNEWLPYRRSYSDGLYKYHQYYGFAASELAAVLTCIVPVFYKKLIGIYLMGIIVTFGFMGSYCWYGSTSSNNYIIENIILILLVCELAVLTLIKKDGKSAWAMMG